MRILYIHQYFATPRGHTGTRSHAQALAMRAAGNDVTVLTCSAQLRPEEVPAGHGVVRRGRIDGLDCIVLEIPYDQRMSYLRRIGSFLRFMVWSCRIVLTDPRPDLVYATSTPLTVGVAALLGKLLRGIPYAFEVRDLWPDVPAALGILTNAWTVRLLRAAEAAIYRHARLLVAVNEDVARAMSRKIGGRKRVVVVPNACDARMFRPDRDGAGFRRRWNLEGKVLCIHPGAMGMVNGLDGILDAAAALRDEPDVRFLLIGQGKERPRLEWRAADEGLSNVLFIDPLPKHELADAMATADVGLMTVAAIPILEWNCANKFFDYLASGLPVVLNYRGWQAKLLADNECGLSAEQTDTEGFIEAVRRLVRGPALRKKMGANARRLAEGALNRQAVVRPLLAALGEIASSLAGPATIGRPAPPRAPS